MKTVRRSGGGHVRSVPRLVSGVTLRAHAHDVRCDTQHSTRARRATLGGEVAGLDAPTNDLLQHPVLYVQHTHCCKVCAAAEVQRAHALTLPPQSRSRVCLATPTNRSQASRTGDR